MCTVSVAVIGLGCAYLLFWIRFVVAGQVDLFCFVWWIGVLLMPCWLLFVWGGLCFRIACVWVCLVLI